MGLVQEIADALFDAALIASDNSEEAAEIALRVVADFLARTDSPDGEWGVHEVAVERLRAEIAQAIASGS